MTRPLLAILVLLAATVARGQSAAGIEVRVRPAVLLEGQRAFLEIDAPENTLDALPAAPAIDGLKLESQGASRNRRGNETRLVAYSIIEPERTGDFTIPPMSLRLANGGQAVTAPFTFTVLPASATGTPPPANRKVHAILLSPRDSYHAGERFPIQALVLVDPDAYLQDLETPRLPREGFAIDRLENPIRGELHHAGRRWLSFAFPSRCTAMASGQLPLGPLDTAAIVGESEETPGFPFQRIRQFKLTAKSEPKTIDVKPLPAGAPAGFDGAVGEFSVAAAFDPPPARADDPVAIRITVAGTGDPAQIKAPRLSGSKEWESFEGSREEAATDPSSLSCQVTFRQILRPKGAPPESVPPFTLVFFNPRTEAYETASSEPLRLPTSLAPAIAAPAPQPASAPSPGTTPMPTPATPPPVAMSPGELLFDIPAAATPHWAGTRPWLTPLLWSLHALGLLAVLGLWLARWHRKWLASDAGRLATCRRDFRRRLQSLGNPDDEATLLAAVRWLDDWQKSPVARPLGEREEKIAALLRDALAAARYSPSRFATVSRTTSLTDLLAPFLKPKA